MSDQKEEKNLPAPRFWTCRQTAAYLGISIHTLYKHMSKGSCPVKVKRPLGGRPLFDCEDVKRYADTL